MLVELGTGAFGFPPDFGLGERILRLWALQLFFALYNYPNDYTPKFYFRL